LSGTRPTVHADIVSKRRTTTLNAGVEHLPNGVGELEELSFVQTVRSTRRTHARQKKRFVRVDVPDTRDGILVKQHRLDRSARARACLSQLSLGDLERIGSQIRPCLSQRL
jgi:hypothetical protein